MTTMRYTRIFILFFFLSLPVLCMGQTSLLSLGLWNISALSGELKVGGMYGEGNINTYDLKNTIRTTNYYGGIMLKSSSYFWNPNFVIIDIDGGYYPESRQDLYLISPNLYNAITTQKLHIGTTFFPRKIVTLNTYVNFDNSYDSRENLTDIRTNSKGYGGTFSFKSKYLPLSLAYGRNNWDSKEIQTGRVFAYEQTTIDGTIDKSFGQKDKNALYYSHHDYLRRDYSLPAIRNISDNLNLQNRYIFDSAKNVTLTSNILGTIQNGNDSFKQLRTNEVLFWKLPHNFTWTNTYGFFYIERSKERLGQHSYNSLLNHQLFESLRSGLLFEYNNSNETSYKEVNEKGGVDINYSKKTFARGHIGVLYSYTKMHQNRASKDVFLQIMNEEYTLSDNTVVILKRPYVDTASVVVKDDKGTTIYQPYFDYILIRRNNFVEIQRVPGGQIPNNAKVYLYYTATQPGSYSYDIDMSTFSINYSLFDNLINLYYKTTRTDFSNVRNADNLLLNYLTENTYGASLKRWNATLGIEFDDYQSNLIPYKMTRYFFNWQANYREKILVAVNANWRDYNIPTEPMDRVYKDVNAMVAYSFNRKTRMDINVGYQSQEGKQINLNLFTGRWKLSTTFKKLTFVAGVDAYDRVYLDNQTTNYLGGYIQVIKKFKY